MTSIFIGIALVIATTLVHHETLYLLSHQLRHVIRPRFCLLLGVMGALLAHVIEILFFAIGYYTLIRANIYGTLTGEAWEGFNDIVYFSFVTYSSLGYGDIRPEGTIRFIAAMEVLTGMVMIAWTASFLYGLIRVAWKRA
jgi:hypothetical protein